MKFIRKIGELEFQVNCNCNCLIVILLVICRLRDLCILMKKMDSKDYELYFELYFVKLKKNVTITVIALVMKHHLCRS